MRLNPSKVRIINDGENFIVYDDTIRGQTILTYEDCIHIPSRFNYNNITGSSIYDTYYEIFKQFEKISDFNSSIFSDSSVFGKRLVITLNDIKNVT